MNYWIENGGVIYSSLLFLMCIYYGLVWARVGCDAAEISGTLTENDFKKKSPALVRYLSTGVMSHYILALMIYELCYRGYLKIEEKHSGFHLTKIRPPHHRLSPWGKMIMEAFFQARERDRRLGMPAIIVLGDFNLTLVNKLCAEIDKLMKQHCEGTYQNLNRRWYYSGWIFPLLMWLTLWPHIPWHLNAEHLIILIAFLFSGYLMAFVVFLSWKLVSLYRMQYISRRYLPIAAILLISGGMFFLMPGFNWVIALSQLFTAGCLYCMNFALIHYNEQGQVYRRISLGFDEYLQNTFPVTLKRFQQKPHRVVQRRFLYALAASRGIHFLRVMRELKVDVETVETYESEFLQFVSLGKQLINMQSAYSSIGSPPTLD